MAGYDFLGAHVGVGRADIVLVLIPLVFLGTLGIGMVALERVRLPLALASIICCLLIADSLYWHEPRTQ